MKRLVIKNGRVIDPAGKIDAISNIYVMSGRVASVKPVEKDASGVAEGPDVEVIDATGLIVIPGLVDVHTHLREPGFEYKETIETGSRAALAGGVTTLACMPNTSPVNDNASVTRFILKKAESTGVTVLPVGAISVGLKGARLTEMAELKDAGCVAVSDDGAPVVDSDLMRRALEYSKAFGLTVISHAEDPVLAADGVMNEGAVSTRLGLRGIPNAAEDSMVARDILLAELTGGRLHVAHVSTRGAVELIRAAKKRGVNVTAEATPHHLVLTEEAVLGYNTNAKMNPPLRTHEDVDALREALADGTIDCVATDHAPHATIDKDTDFDQAAFGIIGLETSFALVYGLFINGHIGLMEAVAALTVSGARVLGLDSGTLRVGSAADIAIVDPKMSWTVDPSRFRSRARNTPFTGLKLDARVVKTIKGGVVVFDMEKGE